MSSSKGQLFVAELLVSELQINPAVQLCQHLNWLQYILNPEQVEPN